MGRSALVARSAGMAMVATLAATSQTPVHELAGTQPNSEFGFAVDTVGDINGDRICDFVVGERRATDDGPQSGRALVFSGADGAIIHALVGTFASLAGMAVSGAGDVDGDGVGDVIVAAPGATPNGSGSGTIRVYSGATGVAVHSMHGLSAHDQLGWSVDAAGDVDADGYADIVAGAPFADVAGSNSGSVTVFSGRDGSVIRTFYGDSPGDLLGISVAGVGDVNGDGFDDIAAGATHDDNNGTNSGAMRVWSGINGAPIYLFSGESAGDQLGKSVAAAGDVDGDGVPDLIAGAWRAGLVGPLSGSAKVWSGANGILLHTLTRDAEQDQFGFSVAGVGDVDGDGFADLLVGAPQNSTEAPAGGAASLFSGLDGSLLQFYAGSAANGRCGWSVASAGDVDDDGFAEILIGSVTEGLGGFARVYDLGITGTPPRARGYGAPCFGTDNRLPRVGIVGETRIGETFTITLHGAAAAQQGTILLVGNVAVAFDLGVIGLTGCTLGVDPYATVVSPTDANGMAQFSFTLGPELAPLGLPIFLQWITEDPGAPYSLGVALSDSLEAIVGN